MSGPPEGLDQVATDVIKVFGREFVAYVLALEGDLGRVDQLTPQQRTVLAELGALLAQLRVPLTDTSGLGPWFAISRVTAIQPEAQQSFPNLFRLDAGGALEVVPDGPDAFETHMLRLAVECYPAFLLLRPRQEAPTLWMLQALNVWQHASYVEAMNAFLADESLQRLFPNSQGSTIATMVDAVSAAQAWWVFNDGHGATGQLPSLITAMLNFAFTQLLVDGGTITPSAYLAIIPRVIDGVRRLARGEAIEVPYLVGFHNFTLVENLSIAGANGVLRTPTERMRRDLVPNGGNVHALLSLRVPLRIIEAVPWQPGEEIDRSAAEAQSRVAEETHRALRRTIDNTKLALMLGSGPGGLIAPSEVARIGFNPIVAGGSYFIPAEITTPLPSVHVTEETSRKVAAWAMKIDRVDARKLDVGVRRVLLAATARTDPIDGFVDAVVCWENLFGARTETTFRVTGAMAWMLEPSDPAKRDTLQDELKKLYETRSRLVHGGLEPSPGQAREYRDRAVDLAIEALRRVLEEPELIKLGSDARSRLVLLRGPFPPEGTAAESASPSSLD